MLSFHLSFSFQKNIVLPFEAFLGCQSKFFRIYNGLLNAAAQKLVKTSIQHQRLCGEDQNQNVKFCLGRVPHTEAKKLGPRVSDSRTREETSHDAHRVQHIHAAQILFPDSPSPLDFTRPGGLNKTFSYLLQVKNNCAAGQIE